MIPLIDITGDGFAGAFANLAAINVNSRHARLRRKWNEGSVMHRKVAAAQIVAFLGKHDDGTPFWRLVGERRKLRGIGEIGLFDSGSWEEMSGGTVTERNRAGFVEEKNVYITRGFDGASGHGENIAAKKPVHARNADSRKQAADCRWDQANQERDQNEKILWGRRVDC